MKIYLQTVLRKFQKSDTRDPEKVVLAPRTDWRRIVLGTTSLVLLFWTLGLVSYVLFESPEAKKEENKSTLVLDRKGVEETLAEYMARDEALRGIKQNRPTFIEP